MLPVLGRVSRSSRRVIPLLDDTDCVSDTGMAAVSVAQESESRIAASTSGQGQDSPDLLARWAGREGEERRCARAHADATARKEDLDDCPRPEA
mmetsp:Transcript_34783/g.82468  ORF Transcript_34783/g.82468 Transcript_34783/m.82468 type:complete len:94 (+) Transcript_34783:660-941(+)